MENEPRLKITRIHPFTKRQAQIIEMKARGHNNIQVARDLRISSGTVKNHVSGCNNGTDTRSDLGILGIIERATGTRPARCNWIAPLIGDVLLFDKKRLAPRKFIKSCKS